MFFTLFFKKYVESTLRFSRFGSFPFRRYSAPQFFTKCIHAWVSPLCMITGFSPGLIRMCAMHTIHLGLAQWMNASAILDLCDISFFKAEKLSEKLVSMTHAFNSWCRVNSIELLSLNNTSCLLIFVGICFCFGSGCSLRLHQFVAFSHPSLGTTSTAFLWPCWGSLVLTTQNSNWKRGPIVSWCLSWLFVYKKHATSLTTQQDPTIWR